MSKSVNTLWHLVIGSNFGIMEMFGVPKLVFMFSTEVHGNSSLILALSLLLLFAIGFGNVFSEDH